MAVLKQDKDSASEQKVEAQSEQAGKGRPTPKRKEAQAQKLRPLVPKDSKEQRKRARPASATREHRIRSHAHRRPAAHAQAERLPWRRVYTRDYIDARFNIGEFFIPVALVILIASVILTAVYSNRSSH